MHNFFSQKQIKYIKFHSILKLDDTFILKWFFLWKVKESKFFYGKGKGKLITNTKKQKEQR